MVKRETGEEIPKGRDRHTESDVERTFPDLSNRAKVACVSSDLSLEPGLQAHLRMSFSRDAFLFLFGFCLLLIRELKLQLLAHTLTHRFLSS